MTSAAVGSESVTSNHALKGRIQDWVLEANSAEDQGSDVSVGKGKGKEKDRDGSGTAGWEPPVNKIKIEVRYGSKRYDVTVDRNDVFHGIERLKTFVSRKKALASITPEPQGGRVDASGGSGRRDGGGGASSSGSATAASAATSSPTVRPDRIRLIHGGCTLGSMWSLKDGDVVVAVDKNSLTSPTFTVKIEGGRDMFLLSRRGETNFSLKLRIWLKYPFERPSKVTLWYDLKDVGDGQYRGFLQKNAGCPPVPDAVASPTASAADGGSEGLCVLDLQRSDPYRSRKQSRLSLTRMDVSKQLFHAFINRQQAYDLPVEVGLVSFGDDVDVPCEPTPLFENFRDEVDTLTPAGNTKLFDAISEACTLLEKWQTEWVEKADKRKEEENRKRKAAGGDQANHGPVPDEKRPVLRVVVLSDGKDTKSTISAHAVCGRLQKVGVIVDSITVGTEKNNQLKCLSLATGGYAFHPMTLRAALRLNELETVLLAGQRARQRPAANARRVSSKYELVTAARLGAPHDTEETATLKEDPMARSKCNSGGGGAVHPERQRRVQREMMDWMKNPHQAFEVFPSDENMHFWKVLVHGPASTPYREGCWMLSMFFPPGYPSVAPKVRFITPIRHCNINSHGRVCHALFDRSWTPNTTVLDVMSCVYGLLLAPDHDDPLDSTLALQMYDSNGQYEAAIIEHVKAHASKPRKVWKAEMEAAGMSSGERLSSSLLTIEQAMDALSAGRLDDAKEQAAIAAVFAAGGPAPIAGPRTTGGGGSSSSSSSARAHEAQFPGLKGARASACLVYAWALLEEPSPNLEDVKNIANDARIYDSTSPEVDRCLVEVARRKWKMCDPTSVQGIRKLKETVHLQKLYVAMLDDGSAVKKGRRRRL
ncbi:conserved unknown protein [Ectocarpus siliculosus]|uniref:UBC core domain-containing protein n=1 Tax=Ectocarpus siliculosus TaxID=2880 RepID=D7FGP8_ECTSI|nr:conserved unknown protein [Ectocarpus siliculosus]|eukprot:CBJ28324.1 conserved unknown protein [Ectocarpus siliculosus]